MDKNESLTFLEKCIDIANSATKEDVDMFKQLYSIECNHPIASSDFEFITPLEDEERYINGV